MIDPARTVFFVPPDLKQFKLNLFNRIAYHVKAKGGKIVRDKFRTLDDLPDEIIPIVGCTIDLRPFIDGWIKRGRQWVYWDRGYARRILATWLPRGTKGGYYRWHVGAYQLREINPRLISDRWNVLQTPVARWQTNGRHIVVAAPSPTYCAFHRCQSWAADTMDALRTMTDRPLVLREKTSTTSMQEELKGAHALVTHASMAAVESVILGTPVFVHPDSAAALVGLTDLTQIESPIYPDRQPWLNTLAYSQFNETELIDGTLWKFLT